MRVHVCYVYQTVCVSACVPEFASVTKWLWTCMPVSVHISVCVCMCMCVVCFNMSTTCGNLIIWNWNMCSCLCLSSLAPPLSFSSFLLLSLLDNSNKFGRSGYTPWYNMPASPFFPPVFSNLVFFFLPISYNCSVSTTDSFSRTWGDTRT